LAGISVFLSLSYIFVVNPAILADAGMDKSAVFFATVVASSLATLFMGIWARLPFVLAPGLEMNAFVAYVIVGVGATGMGLSWQQALGIVFWSGIIFMILTFVTNFREAIIDAINDQMKLILAFSVGVFVFAIGLRITNVFIYDNTGFVEFGSFISPEAIAMYIGVTILAFLHWIKFPAAIIISILASAIYINIAKGIGEVNASTSETMFTGIFALDLSTTISGAFLSAVFLLFVVDFYGSVAKFIALTVNIPEVKIREKTPNALKVDGGATVVGAVLGTSSITTFVESAVGIGAGGKSGLTAVFCSLFMALSLFLVPLLVYIPVAATAPALIYVGYKLFPNKALWHLFSKYDWALLVVCGLIVWLLFSLDIAMLVGFTFYLVLQCHSKFIVKEENAKVSVPLLVSAFLLLLSRLLA
jgi:AGZA family xanthine/uracil permease-like MFS transporter